MALRRLAWAGFCVLFGCGSGGGSGGTAGSGGSLGASGGVPGGGGSGGTDAAGGVGGSLGSSGGHSGAESGGAFDVAGSGGSLGAAAGDSASAGDTALAGSADEAGAGGCAGADCGSMQCVPKTARTCYDGPPATANIGVCHSGTQICASDGLSWGPCVGEVLPSQQLCLGKDEDCDDVPQPLGCTPCTPGASSCTGNVSTYCPDGLGEVVENCDALEGLSCQNGHCQGSCSKAALGDSSNVGCDFYPMVTANAVNGYEWNFVVAASNPAATSVSVTVYRGATQVGTAVTVPAHGTKTIVLPWINELKGPSDGSPMPGSVRLDSGAYHLRSTGPISAYQLNAIEAESGSAEGSLLFPTTSWTGRYMVAARHSFIGFSGFYAITARDDGTIVTVAAPGSGVMVKAGVTGIATTGAGTVTLNAGDVIEIVTGGTSAVSDPNDVTGTLVTATGPIEVIAGHQCTNVPDGTDYCDHLEESMLPVEALSTSYFVTAPAVAGMTLATPEEIRIITTLPNTTLTFDPPQAGAPSTIANAGGWAALSTNAADFKLVANKPVLVAQYLQGLGDATYRKGEPALTVAIPATEYRSSYSFYTPSIYFSEHYINVTAPTGAAVTLDGALIDATSFKPIGSSTYSLARVPLVAADAHAISAAVPIGVSSYGYDPGDGYWYPAGTQLLKLNQ